MPKTLDFLFTPGDPPKPGSSNPHAKSTTHNQDVVDALKKEFADDVLKTTEYANEQTVYVSKERIVDVARFLREKQDFNYLVDLAGIDLFTEKDRFEVFYNLVSIKGRKRIRIKILVDEDDMNVPSIVGIYRSANWNEREVWDMLGVNFEGHPDLRRMYMPEDYEHFPLRKEFPNLGIPGSLPLPSQKDDGKVEMDPFVRAHGQKPEHGTPFSE